MVFSTPVFMFGFLVIVLTIYYVVPIKWRNAVLLCSSLFFYYWGEQGYTIIMIVSTIIDYTHGWLVEYYKKKENKYIFDQPILYSKLKEEYKTKEEISKYLLDKCNKLGLM